MSGRVRNVTGLLVLIVVAAVGITCAGGDQGSDNTLAGVSPRLMTSEQSARVSSALARTRWVGTIHDDAMRDIVRNRGFYVRAEDPVDRRSCLGLERMLRKYGPRIDSAMGVVRSPEDREAVIGSVMAHSAVCRRQGMSMFGVPGFRWSPASVVFEDTVTGAYESHAQAISDGTAATSGLPSEVTGVTNGVWLPHPPYRLLIWR